MKYDNYHLVQLTDGGSCWALEREVSKIKLNKKRLCRDQLKEFWLWLSPNLSKKKTPGPTPGSHSRAAASLHTNASSALLAMWRSRSSPPSISWVTQLLSQYWRVPQPSHTQSGHLYLWSPLFSHHQKFMAMWRLPVTTEAWRGNKSTRHQWAQTV